MFRIGALLLTSRIKILTRLLVIARATHDSPLIPVVKERFASTNLKQHLNNFQVEERKTKLSRKHSFDPY